MPEKTKQKNQATTDYEFIQVSTEGRVGVILLHRPKVLNALSPEMMSEIVEVLQGFDDNPEVGAIVITGGEKVFAAGADIGKMATASAVDMLDWDQLARWDLVRLIKKPIIAGINGYALGGGNELAMMCDILIAGENAKFGQPEISIGVMPGAGGTQRLTRAVGKARAMEYVLTGRQFDAKEAFEIGLITKVVPPELMIEETMTMATLIANQPNKALQMGKAAILKSFDTTLEGGLDFERKLFYMLFATQDQKEGMGAFMEKRKPEWQHY